MFFWELFRFGNESEPNIYHSVHSAPPDSRMNGVNVFRMNKRSFGHIEIPCLLLFLNRNRNSQNKPKRMHPKFPGIFPVQSQQRGLMSRMRLRKVESTEILFETRENERWRPLSRRP